VKTSRYITVIIPAFNEELTIIKTLREYAEFFPDAFFIVVDNNSTDKTYENASITLSQDGLDGLVITENLQGKANAINSALSRVQSIWWIMTDADATYPAADMRALFDLMETKRFDHGVLDRISSKNYVSESQLKTFIHKTGNQFFSGLISLLTKVQYRDVLSGGRILSCPFVESFVINSSGFELESEINFHAAKISAKTTEYKCNYRPRDRESPSKLSTFKDGVKILYFILDLGLKKKPDIFASILAWT